MREIAAKPSADPARSLSFMLPPGRLARRISVGRKRLQFAAGFRLNLCSRPVVVTRTSPSGVDLPGALRQQLCQHVSLCSELVRVGILQLAQVVEFPQNARQLLGVRDGQQ